MKEIIINQPHLQSFQQKCASVFMAFMSWALWLYFLWPLFTLAAWLMGLKSLSDEIRWFGGYKTLLELLELYGQIVLAIALFWLCWTLFLSWRHSVVAPKRSAPVTDQQLAVAFKVDLAELRQARKGKKLTIHFDDHAGITAIGND